MKLEIAKFPVQDVVFSQRTAYKNGILEINKEELLALVLQDSRIVSADLDLVFPGEKTRVVNIRDIIEPRVKVSGPGCVFPGIMGPIETVGEGRTNRLSGVTIMASAEYRPTIMGGTAAQNTAILDMWGPAAEITPFSSTINIVLVLKLADTVTEWDAHSSIQMAEFKLGNQLAETTRDRTPAEIENFDISQVNPSLPNVVYVLGCLTMLGQPHSNAAYYGWTIQESMPFYVDPNELLDGALTTSATMGNGGYTNTWNWTNHPMVFSLLRQHGKTLNFMGVILQRTRFITEDGKKVSATAAAQMAKRLGADGAIVTRTIPSGNNFMDSMLTVQALEKKGIKTALMTPEWGGSDGTELPLVFYVPEATAIISSGSTERVLNMPAPSKVVGVKKGQLTRLYVGDPPFDPWGEYTAHNGWRDVIGGIDWFGNMHITCSQY